MFKLKILICFKFFHITFTFNFKEEYIIIILSFSISRFFNNDFLMFFKKKV